METDETIHFVLLFKYVLIKKELKLNSIFIVSWEMRVK